MIALTKLRGEPITVNAELIETVEATPDTIVTLTNGHTLVVRESPERVTALAIQYRRTISARIRPIIRYRKPE